jgi:hypothetical protein
MSCEGRDVWQSPEEPAVCGYDPDLAPRCLEVLTNRDENGDARVVNLAQVTEIEHRGIVTSCARGSTACALSTAAGNRSPDTRTISVPSARSSAMWS